MHGRIRLPPGVRRFLLPISFRPLAFHYDAPRVIPLLHLQYTSQIRVSIRISGQTPEYGGPPDASVAEDAPNTLTVALAPGDRSPSGSLPAPGPLPARKSLLPVPGRTPAALLTPTLRENAAAFLALVGPDEIFPAGKANLPPLAYYRSLWLSVTSPVFGPS